MRKLNHDKAYTEDDIEWIRNSGIPFGEEMIVQNAEQHGVKVPDPEVPEDETNILREVVGENAAGQRREIDPQSGAPRLIDPVTAPEIADDYDTWSKAELEAEVVARNEMPDTSEVEVTGSGKNGNVLAADLIKGLRLWDQDNPEALKADDEG